LLADSFRADPATGTLLALALCLDGQGKVASAWKAYNEVAIRSAREGRTDREKVARTKAGVLESQISLLTITVPPAMHDLDGLEIRRNGGLVDSANWGKAIAVDGGTQQIEASAPGREKWRTSVVVAPKGDTKTVTVPPLEESEPAVATLARPPASDPPPIVTTKPDPPSSNNVTAPVERPDPITATHLSALQGAGVATFVAGVAGIGFGGFFTLRAISKNKDSKAGCDSNNVCTAQGAQDRWDAHDAGNLATIGFIGGGVLTVGGAALYLLGRPSRVLVGCAGTTCIEATPAASTDGFGGVVRGTFW
jgi:hypothetical protein